MFFHRWCHFCTQISDFWFQKRDQFSSLISQIWYSLIPGLQSQIPPFWSLIPPLWSLIPPLWSLIPHTSLRPWKQSLFLCRMDIRTEDIERKGKVINSKTTTAANLEAKKQYGEIHQKIQRGIRRDERKLFDVFDSEAETTTEQRRMKDLYHPQGSCQENRIQWQKQPNMHQEMNSTNRRTSWRHGQNTSRSHKTPQS